MALTKGTYTVPAKTQQFQDCVISAATLADGTLRQRFDRKAFPQKGVKYTGTDHNGKAVPAPAKKSHGVGS